MFSQEKALNKSLSIVFIIVEKTDIKSFVINVLTFKLTTFIDNIL